MGEKIFHVEFAVTDKKAAAKWYAGVLGWEVQEFPEFDYIQIFSGEGEPSVALVDTNPEQGMPAGSALVYLDTPDVDDLLARFEQNGAQLIGEKLEIPLVGTMFVVADPFGNRIAAMQRAEVPEP